MGGRNASKRAAASNAPKRNVPEGMQFTHGPLPLFLLRPFDFGALPARLFQHARDDRAGAAMVPALLIMMLGLVATWAGVPALEHR